MKLSSALVQRTLDQFDAQPIPETHPAIPQLNKLFGEHTFFLGGRGLHVVETVDATDADGATGKVVKLADWKDAEHTSLLPCDPEDTDIVVLLDDTKAPPDSAS